MGYARMMELRRPTSGESVREGVTGLPMPDPTNLYEKDLKDMEYYMDRKFTMEFLLRVEDVFDPVRRNLINTESSWSGQEPIFTSKFYLRTLTSREIVSNILNEVDFYAQSYDDVVRLHEMLYRLFRNLEDASNTMGLRNVVNPFVLDKLEKYIRKMEDRDDFIIISKQIQHRVSKNKVGFVEVRNSDLSFIVPREAKQGDPIDLTYKESNQVQAPQRPGVTRIQAMNSLLHEQEEDELPIHGYTPTNGNRQAFLTPKEINLETREAEPIEYVTNGELTPSKKKRNSNRIMIDF